MTIQEQLPELNANQITMLHRLMVECLGEKIKVDYVRLDHLDAINQGYNNCHDQALRAVNTLFGVEV